VRTYYLHDLEPGDIRRLKRHLKDNGHSSPLEDMYWFEMPQELLSQVQREHAEECGPYVFPLETGDTWIMLELLVRPRNALHCSCIHYATDEQRAHIIQRLDAILRELGIAT